LIEDGLTGRVTRLHDDPKRSRQHIFVEDVVDAVWGALESTALSQCAYNIGPGVSQNIDEIVNAVHAVVPSAAIELTADGHAWNTFALGPLAIEAAKRDLGFAPSTSLEDGAAQTKVWVQSRM
jgi:nucleoside-diphosphate-sugar epimerase